MMRKLAGEHRLKPSVAAELVAMLMEAEHVAEAGEVIREAIRSAPSNPRMHALHAGWLTARGNLAAAERCYRQALALAAAGRGEILEDAGGRAVDEAGEDGRGARIARRAWGMERASILAGLAGVLTEQRARLRGGDPPPPATSGQVRVEEGCEEVELWREAVKLAPTAPGYWNHLASALWGSSQRLRQGGARAPRGWEAAAMAAEAAGWADAAAASAASSALVLEEEVRFGRRRWRGRSSWPRLSWAAGAGATSAPVVLY